MLETNPLLAPVRLGPYVLKNRVVMSPMTRNRSPGEVPNRLNAEYYAQRTGAGLIVTESTAISPQGLGWIDSSGSKLRSLFRGTYIANNGYTRERATQALAEHMADLFAFGRFYVANPDVAERLRVGASLNTLDPETLYDGGARGYTDYPLLAAN